MPADVLSNSLGFSSTGKDQSLKTGILNKNQLFSSDSFADFDFQLDQQIAKTQQVQRRNSAAIERDPAPSQAARHESTTNKSGNELPRDDQARRSRQSQAAQSAGAREQSSADRGRSRSAENRDSTGRVDDNRRSASQQESTASSRESASVAPKTSDGIQRTTNDDEAHNRVVEGNQQADATNKADAKALDDSKDQSLKQTNETFLLDAQGLEAQVEKAAILESQRLQQWVSGEVEEVALEGKQLSAQQLLDKTLILQRVNDEAPIAQGEGTPSLTTTFDTANILPSDRFIDASALLRESVLSQEIKGAITDLSADKSGKTALSIEERLKALLGDAGVKLVDSEGDALPENGGAEGAADAAINTQLENVANTIELTDEEAVLIASTLKEKGLLTADGKVDLSQSNTAKQVLSQWVAIKSAKEGLSTDGEAFKAERLESPGDESEEAGDVDLALKLNDKLALKNSDKLSELSLGDLNNTLRAGGKQGESLLQQRLNGAIEQIKAGATETGKSDSSTATKVSTATVTTAMAGMGKPSDVLGTQQASTKSFTMTMQNHFSKPSWGPELGQRLMMMVGQKIQVAEIRLDPPDMGPMEVKVKMNQEQAHVVFNTQHAAVKDALEQAMPKLKELFEQNGLSLGDVDVKDQSAQQKEGEDIDHDDTTMLAGEGEIEGGVEEKESATVMQSDRLVDFYA